MLRSPRRLHHTLGAVGATLAIALATVGLQPGSATGASPAPVEIVVDAVYSEVNSAPAGTPDEAVPSMLVAAGEHFKVDVRFLDADGNAASFSKDTTLTITTNTGADNLPASHPSWTVPAGAEEWTLTTSLPESANQVQVTVSAPAVRGKPTVKAGVFANLFDVLKQIEYVPDNATAGTPLTAGIGGRDGCTEATPTNPVCGTVVLPVGAASSQILLSLGRCAKAYVACDERGSVVQLLADLNDTETGDPETGDLYGPTTPATMVIRCDKELCGGGAIRKKGLNYSLLGNASLTPAPACPAKNTLGRDPDGDPDSPLNQEVCVDYTQSTRDGSGDTILYLLFTRDARISVS